MPRRRLDTAGTKPPHAHLLLKFKKKQPQKLGYVAQWSKVPEDFINCKGKSWESACLCLAHVNAPDKFRYAIADVSASFDYNEFIEEYLAEQEDEEEDDGEDGTSKRKKKKKSPIEIVVERILKGEVREYNKTLEIDQKLLIHCSRQIDQAFKVRSEYLHATQKDRRMECVYITGPSGCGKTTLARKNLNCELVILTTVPDIYKFYANVFSGQEDSPTKQKRTIGEKL